MIFKSRLGDSQSPTLGITLGQFSGLWYRGAQNRWSQWTFRALGSMNPAGQIQCQMEPAAIHKELGPWVSLSSIKLLTPLPWPISILTNLP